MKLGVLARMLDLRPRGLRGLASVDDFERAANRKLPRIVSDFVSGGSDCETTVQKNLSAFDQIEWAPRYLSDVSDRSVSTEVFGEPLKLPVMLSPAGLASLVHRDGELAAAKAAERAGTVFVVSTASSFSLEAISAVTTGRLWLQVYLWKSREVVGDLVKRAKAANYEALVLTVDVPVVGKRVRDIRNGMAIPPRIRPSSVLNVLRRPRWLAHLLAGPDLTFGSLVGAVDPEGQESIAAYVDRELSNAAATWEELTWLRGIWKGPLLVKGIVAAEDAKEALRRGADGIIVSNHGGRQLDSCPASINALPRVVEAVGDRIEVFMDGGVRRGSDVLKAKALGARAVFVGRPWFWALAAGGQDGVERMLGIFSEEIDRTLALVGSPNFHTVSDSNIWGHEGTVPE
ncbi:MAG: alpha-hydroxy-acid oxidizing enzyme [Acidimicrobiaceae bacterium]|nr:alpha-hydroxy-acid oxidizing enzyme [Acidimicrobiaceae bacterium]|tara:strand:- start:14812 stop:16017 length:1206 start_codon:yes stop_codon:yes gene_type:complete